MLYNFIRDSLVQRSVNQDIDLLAFACLTVHATFQITIFAIKFKNIGSWNGHLHLRSIQYVFNLLC